MKKTRFSIILYLKSRPFFDGLKESDLAKEINLSVDNTSKDEVKLVCNLANARLMPVAGFDDYIADYFA